MLSSSSPAQKNLDKEESSGSDAGSEVGLEPETDRFGFIVTKGCTAGSVGPPPELVRQREAKWINIIVQWDHILLKKTSKVKVQSQKGIPASLRAKCWPLLCGATDMMKQNKNLYQYLDSQPALQSWVDVIERDLDRQFPFHEMFLSKDGHGQRGLFRVLKAFTQYQPDDGYCQAQGPVAAVLLMNMPAEEAFWCLVQISEHYLPGYYSPLLEGVLFDAAMLTWVLKKTCPAAYKHLQRHDVEPLMFATDWLMCLFTRHLPFNTLLRVWDLFFCYGVRVLLQVVVVLVCRVLGRAEQRKRCQGQMETLEKLRGVREQVQEEEDSFIAEVCSVPLSDRDLEKQMEKELEKWRKSRPSSTFNPRGRCQGFQMAWERARQKEEDQDRKERVRGNLSIPLARSASALSLSPYVIQTRWRKGGKVSAHEWEAGDRAVRRLSVGSKEAWRSSTESNFKKVQGVQEDKVSEEHKKQTEPKLGGQTDHKEPKQTDKVQNIPTEQGEETVTVKEQTEQVETRISEKEESQLKETEENKVLSEQIEERNVEAEPPRGSSKDQTVGNICQPTEHTTHHQQGAELNPYNQSQVLEQQSQKGDENEVSNQNEERVKQEVESEPSPAGKETQTETQKYALVDTNTVQQATDVSATSETSQGSETDGKVEAPTVREPAEEIQTQQKQQKVIIETDRGSQGDAFEGEHHRPESLSETDMEEESHTKTATEIEVEVEAEIVQMDSEAETLILCSPECIQPKEGTDLVADVQTEAKIPVSNDTTRESSEAITQCSEAKYDAVASEATYDKEESFLTVNSEAQNDLTQAEETPTQTQMNEETSNSIAPPQKEVTSPQGEEVNSTPGPDGKTSSVEMNTSEERAPEQPKIQATVGAVEGEGSTAPFQERTIGEDIFISTEPSDSNTDRNPQVQDRESHLVKDKIVPSNNSLSQASVHHCSRSSRDICIRKSSSYCGPRIGRRLSEDLFTMPQKTSKSQSIPNKPVAKHTESQSDTGTVNPPQTNPDSTQSSEITLSLSEEVPKSTEVQPGSSDPLKRFGLFRRVRGDQPKKTKAKGALKMQVPKILIQDFSDGTAREKPFVEEVEEKLSSRERRRQRRDGERREREEERVRKKREKELEKVKERERKRLQTRGKSFQVQNEKGSGDEPHPAKTASQTHRYSASHADSYF